MLQITKIFRFEMAHALHNYRGACSNIHGHSYELYVTVAGENNHNGFIPTQGFIMDFKELKSIVTESVIRHVDHKLVLSRNYSNASGFIPRESVVIWEFEPTAENIVLYIRERLSSVLPPSVRLIQLKLYETKDSFVTWVCPADN